MIWRIILKISDNQIRGWNTLSKQIIDAIKAAENEAARKKAAATEKAKTYSAERKIKAKEKYEADVESAKRDMSDKLSLIGSQSEALIAKNKAEAEAEAAKETEAAMQNMDAAVEIIIGELIKNVGK